MREPFRKHVLAHKIVSRLIQEAESVPGNHYANSVPRLDKAFSAFYSDIPPE